MITVLTGDNTFEIERALQAIIAQFDGVAEKIDGSELTLKQLPDVLMGGTLFASRRLVVIKGLSDNKALWIDFADWLPRVSDDIHLILVESKLDKRTKTYKDLQKVATLSEHKAWTERDTGQAERWVADEAARLGCQLDARSVRFLVQRVGNDQWLLHQALQKLVVLDEINEAVIADIVEANPVENVFELFESALKGDALKIKRMVATLSLAEDPYRLFGLLSGQAFHVALLAVTDKPSAEIAKEFGVHPYALGKLVEHANRLKKPGAKKVIAAFSEADHGMKSSAADPWLLIERALMKVTEI